MRPFLDWLFRRKGRVAKKFLDDVKMMNSLSNEIKTKQERLDTLEYHTLLEKKEEFYLSLSNFLELMEISNLGMQEILKRCKHVSELDGKSCSVIEIHAVLEDNHIVLCPDVKECDKHKGMDSEKMKIAMIRRK